MWNPVASWKFIAETSNMITSIKMTKVDGMRLVNLLTSGQVRDTELERHT